jgi:nucleoside-diphosphate-sugar epimerase
MLLYLCFPFQTVTLVGMVVKHIFPGMRDYVALGRGPFKLKPFAVTMMTINRSFDISCAQQDLGYTPLVPFKESWPLTIDWFNNNRSFWDDPSKKEK